MLTYHLGGCEYLWSQDGVEVVGDGVKNKLAVVVGSASVTVERTSRQRRTQSHQLTVVNTLLLLGLLWEVVPQSLLDHLQRTCRHIHITALYNLPPLYTRLQVSPWQRNNVVGKLVRILPHDCLVRSMHFAVTGPNTFIFSQYDTIWYTMEEFNVDWNAECGQFDLEHATKTKT